VTHGFISPFEWIQINAPSSAGGYLTLQNGTSTVLMQRLGSSVPIRVHPWLNCFSQVHDSVIFPTYNLHVNRNEHAVVARICAVLFQ
jgi:hypothetical protein